MVRRMPACLKTPLCYKRGHIEPLTSIRSLQLDIEHTDLSGHLSLRYLNPFLRQNETNQRMHIESKSKHTYILDERYRLLGVVRMLLSSQPGFMRCRSLIGSTTPGAATGGGKNSDNRWVKHNAARWAAVQILKATNAF